MVIAWRTVCPGVGAQQAMFACCHPERSAAVGAQSKDPVEVPAMCGGLSNAI